MRLVEEGEAGAGLRGDGQAVIADNVAGKAAGAA